MVQGGTFRNDAVLRALEQYLGREVVRPPYAGMMGAIGGGDSDKGKPARAAGFGTARAAYLYRPGRHGDIFLYAEGGFPLSILRQSLQAHHSHLPQRENWVTNNRCERGEIVGDPKDAAVRAQVMEAGKQRRATENLFDLRQKLLFQDYPIAQGVSRRETVIGLPRVLSFWELAPFWTTFWRSLGFQVQLSDLSTRAMYENGLEAVTSDTVCFPAKLVHGHIRNLVSHKVGAHFHAFPLPLRRRKIPWPPAIPCAR